MRACTLPADVDPFVALFSESAARAVVAVPSPAVDAVLASCANAGVPVERLGRTGGTALVVEGLFEVAVDELRPAAEGTFPALFG